MTISEALKAGTEKIINQAVNCKHLSPALDSEVLLCFVMNTDKTYLLLHPDKNLTAKQKKKFLVLSDKRAKGVPIAYLVGTKEFFGLNFLVNRKVLIPRPETECMVEEIINNISGEGIKILDVGTGSGCIILSLAKSLSGKNIYCACDVSKDALSVAKKNAKTHRMKVRFKQSDLLTAWKREPFHVIVANLPYGWKGWANNTSAPTAGLKFEPQEALFASKQGLFLIEKLLNQIRNRKQNPSLIALEFDPRQRGRIKKLAKEYLPDFQLRFFKDLARRTRFCLLLDRKSV